MLSMVFIGFLILIAPIIAWIAYQVVIIDTYMYFIHNRPDCKGRRLDKTLFWIFEPLNEIVVTTTLVLLYTFKV